MATGLGAVNAQELVNNWATPDATGAAVTVSIGISPVQVNSIYNPAAQVTLTSTVDPVNAGRHTYRHHYFLQHGHLRSAFLGIDGNA